MIHQPDQNSILKTDCLYSGTGERLLQIYYKDDGKQTHKTYHYAPDGRLLQESFYNKQGHKKRTKHYLWLDTQPLAYIEQRLRNNGSIKQEHVAYLHTDHLNTPRLATDGNQAIVWRWDSNAFGLGKADKDPDGDGLKLNIALRFPGQCYDGESGLHYSCYRDYDPRTGRYIESDPIGLEGGLNTYAYVGGNPLRYSDPLGLKTAVIINGATNGNPFGHTEIAATGNGVYSNGNSTKLGSSLTDYLKREAPKRNSVVIVINTTSKHEDEINDYLKNSEDNLPPWILGYIPNPT